MFKSLKKFDTISLTEMDAKMGSIGLDRMENKYIIHVSMLDKFLKELQDDYVALEIHGLREFKYNNVYFDTKDYKFFHEHGKGYKLRTKLRTRKYVDSKIAFFEYKQRYYENVRKFKYDIKLDNHGKFNKKASNFTQKLHESLYHKKIEGKVTPSLSTEYIRFTLCAKSSGERITFDTKVIFKNLRDKKSRPYMLSDIVLVESKSMNSKHQTEEILKKFGVEKMGGISKYCLGLLCEEAINTKYKRFEDVLKHITQLQKTIV